MKTLVSKFRKNKFEKANEEEEAVVIPENKAAEVLELFFVSTCD